MASVQPAAMAGLSIPPGFGPMQAREAYAVSDPSWPLQMMIENIFLEDDVERDHELTNDRGTPR
jgi:hypothetical protein